MGTWGDGLLENDSALDLWEILVAARSEVGIQRAFEHVFQEYDRFERAVTSGTNFATLSADEVEQRIAEAKATPGNDNKHWKEFEEVLRETYSETIEWEGTREADQVLAAALILHALVTRSFLDRAWGAPSASRLIAFTPVEALLYKARAALKRIATNPAKRKESRGWTKRVARTLEALGTQE
ncbi:MAG: hypothetical protein RKO66_18105 [Candidatus Contendobacter sp.]|nr:hypothetical protein [Candidatus Contendobacter sp.]MDS4059911.1 hypothetical protein [Candidatus Contendobacter sp.]